MLINHAACKTRIRSACCNLVSSNGETPLLDAGVPKWRPGWSRRGGADKRTVAEAVTEMAAGGRGSKRRRKREGLQRGERNRQWLLVFGWWLCWLPMVELMVGRPVMRVVVAETAERERERRKTA